MISERFGPMPGIDARCTFVILASLSARRRTSGVVAIPGLLRAPRLAAVPLPAPLRGRERLARLGQRGRRAGGRDHQVHSRDSHLALGAAEFTVDVLLQAGDVLLLGRIGAKELLLQADRAERQAHHLLDASLVGERDLAASTAEIDQHAASPRPRLQRDDAEMDQAAFFEAGDHLDLPAGGRLDPRRKGCGVAGVAHGAGGHHANLVHHVELHRLLETLECADGVRHRVGGDDPRLEDALAQAHNLAIFMQRLQMMLLHRCDLQPNGVGTDIDGGKRGHGSGFSQRSRDRAFGRMADEKSPPLKSRYNARTIAARIQFAGCARGRIRADTGVPQPRKLAAG